jgi:threonine dehydrogenase-like Zn-dependent dehydrogenase
MGSMMVGRLEQTGNGTLAHGTTVYAWAPIADLHVLPAADVLPLGDLKPEQALCIDPASFALGGTIDGAIGPSDRVLVTGLGAIGLFVIQYAKAAGATVWAASRFEARRQLALRFGAAAVYDPGAHPDLARLVKRRGGVSAAIECSGNLATLQLAIRATRQCGRVVCVGFYGPGELNLGEEFLHNRISLLASLPALSWNNPVRAERPLHAKDLQAMAARDFHDGTISAEGMLDPVVPFQEADKAVRLIAEAPQRVVKVLIRHE